MPKNNPYKSIIIFVVLDLLALGGWFFFYSKANKLETEINLQNDQLALEDAKGEYVADISQDLRSTEKERALLDQSFVYAGDESLFLESIESLATTSGVTMDVKSFEPDDGGLHLAITTLGSFAKNYFFLSLLESSSYELEINQVSLKAVEKDNQPTWEGRYDIKLVSYIEK